MSQERTPSPIPSLEAGEVRRALLFGGLLLLGSRIVLTALGLLSRGLLEAEFGAFYLPDWIYSHRAWLDLWGIWDTGWYLHVAGEGYPIGVALDPALHAHGRISFFPFYPALIRVGMTFDLWPFVSAMLVANGALVVSCGVLYRLVRLDADEATARRSLKYLLLFPSGFILSGALADSSLLALSLLVFYLVRTDRLAAAGFAGFCLALTKPTGFLFVLPAAWELWVLRGRRLDPSFLWLGLLPAGLAAFAGFCLWAVGDPFAYSTIKAAQFDTVLGNPVATLIDGLRIPELRVYAGATSALLVAVLVAPWGRLRFSYRLAVVLVILLSVTAGVTYLPGMPRYLAGLFPFAILLANLTSDEGIDQAVTVTLALLQGGLMVLWCNGLFII